jgi:hypothetical protein
MIPKGVGAPEPSVELLQISNPGHQSRLDQSSGQDLKKRYFDSDNKQNLSKYAAKEKLCMPL